MQPSVSCHLHLIFHSTTRNDLRLMDATGQGWPCLFSVMPEKATCSYNTSTIYCMQITSDIALDNFLALCQTSREWKVF